MVDVTRMITRRGGCSNVGGHGRDGPGRGCCGCWLNVRMQWYHPQACMREFVPTHNCAAPICDGAPYFCEEYIASRVASVTTLMRECDAKPGMMWARCAADGRPGRSNVPVCVERTLSPLGRRATIGFWVGWMLVTCAPVVRKLLVVPESKMAHLLMVAMSMLTVRRSVAGARACGGWGSGE